jgi:hypothetical protein
MFPAGPKRRYRNVCFSAAVGAQADLNLALVYEYTP